MNFFEFYDLPAHFLIDTKQLRRRYLEKSQEFHPDFFTQASQEAQQEALHWTAFNNEAYRTLNDRDKRFKYLLSLHGHWGNGEQNDIPQDFLMDMMDINEAIMELSMSPNLEDKNNLLEKVQKLDKEAFEDVLPAIENYDPEKTQPEVFEKVKLFEKKVQYFLRIQENIRNIAFA